MITTPAKLSPEDEQMVLALDGVEFGRWNASRRFIESIIEKGVRTARQRWWLHKLVVRYRRQIKSDLALVIAQTWLAKHVEPKSKPRAKKPRNSKCFAEQPVRNANHCLCGYSMSRCMIGIGECPDGELRNAGHW